MHDPHPTAASPVPRAGWGLGEWELEGEMAVFDKYVIEQQRLAYEERQRERLAWCANRTVELIRDLCIGEPLAAYLAEREWSGRETAVGLDNMAMRNAIIG